MSFSIEFEREYESKDGDTQILHIECTFSHFVDNNYGADADGRRGVPMTFIEMEKIAILDEDGNDITDLLHDSDPDEYASIEDEATSLAQEEDPGDEDEDDYDDYDDYDDDYDEDEEL